MTPMRLRTAWIWCRVTNEDRQRTLGTLRTELVEELAHRRRGQDHVV